MGIEWKGCAFWAYAWLGAAGLMLLVFLFSLFGGSDDESFDGFSESDLRALSGASGSRAGSSDGDSSGSGYTPPDSAAAVNRILVDQFGEVAGDFSVQDMLDGDGFDHTTSAIVAEGGRERTGVLLADLLAKAEIDDWSRVRLLGAFGEAIDVDRASFDATPDQYLLYWSSDGDPSATVSITDPVTGGRVTDVTNIVILE